MPNRSISLDRVFWALGDPTRFAIIEQLARCPASVSELAKPFKMALPTFMQHLGVLEKYELVTSIKKVRVRTCSLNEARMEEIKGWLDTQRVLWNARFDALDEYLKQTKDP